MVINSKIWQESEEIEFKETLAERESAGADMCAFANRGGGTIYFGVKNDGEIRGLGHLNEKTIRDLGQLYRDNSQPVIYPSISIIEIDGKSLIKVEVSKSDTPYHVFKHTPYVRMGSSSPVMKQEEYRRRLVKYRGGNTDYSSSAVEKASMDDLSRDAIFELRRLLKKSSRSARSIDHLSDVDLLKNLQLIQYEKITVAALILLGSEAGLVRHLPYSEIRYGFRLSEDELRNQDSVIFKGGYFLYYEALWEKINNRNLTLNIPHGLFLSERKAFEEDTIREAINNAVIHRDYQLDESIFILQYPTTIQIKSPGGFVEGINLENILNESKVRNKLVADILFRCEFVEQFGTGVNLMFRNQLSLGKNPPDFSKSNEHRVVLNLDGSIQDIDFAKCVLRVADEKQKTLTENELLLLYKIKQGKKVKAAFVRSLLEMGLIEKVGYGKWILSKRYYADTQQKGLYTRNKGLDKETNKELILKHLKAFPEGAKKRELMDVLPQLEWMQIWRLLGELRKEGMVIFTGGKRSKSGVYKLK